MDKASSGTIGTTIEIFLPDDDHRGVRVAEITTGIVSALQIPRSQVARVRNICDELSLPQAALYVLFESSQDSIKPRIYIGQTDSISRRLREHLGSRDFWETALIFVSQKFSFTPTHTEYLEWHATEIAKNIARYEVIPNKCAKPGVRPPLRQEILKCFDSIRLLSAVLGFPAFEPIAGHSSTATEKRTFFCKGPGADARGLMRGNEFVVLKGSVARAWIVSSALGKVGRLRKSLLDAKILVSRGRSFVFDQDFPFASPSAAANAVLGRNVNGWDVWRDQSGKSIDALYRQK